MELEWLEPKRPFCSLRLCCVHLYQDTLHTIHMFYQIHRTCMPTCALHPTNMRHGILWYRSLEHWKSPLALCHFKGSFSEHLAWPFTASLNRNITITWGFFRLLAPMCTGRAAGAVCLKKPHHIVRLRFSVVVKGHANYTANGHYKQFENWQISINL